MGTQNELPQRVVAVALLFEASHHRIIPNHSGSLVRLHLPGFFFGHLAESSSPSHATLIFSESLPVFSRIFTQLQYNYTTIDTLCINMIEERIIGFDHGFRI